MESIGERIRSKREELGFDRHHYAVALLVPPDTITQLEADHFKEIPRRWLTRIASLSGLETKDLLAETNVHFYDHQRQVYVLRSE